MTAANASRQAPPATMTIFGAAGDLTKRLVVPALYNLVRAGALPDQFSIIGIDRNPQTTETWRRNLSSEMRDLVQSGGGEFQAEQIDQRAWDWLTSRMRYLQGDFTDPATYRELKSLLAEQNHEPGAGGNILFYLATADRFFCEIIRELGGAGITAQSEGAWRRVIVEKPFGHDYPSAKALNEGILKSLSEDQIYRIDHFLGKEPVRNIMVLRFANGIFEPLWSRHHIDYVQITAAETLGVEERGRFYERTGALRDMVPNHLFQLLAMIAMEPPTCFGADAVRAKKTELFDAIHPVSPADSVRGQYGAGTVLGRAVQGYSSEPDVAPDSTVETYAALKLGIENWRWAGVPFYLRTGKRLAAHKTEIAIQFKQAPYALFRDTQVERLPPNILTLRVQPDEGLAATFSAKRPGPEIEIDGVAMNFSYRDYFEPLTAVGYEILKFRPKAVMNFASALQRAVKIVGVNDDLERVKRCESDAQAALGHRATAARSQPYYLDVTHPDANKGFVAGYLSRLFDIPEEEIATIGDQPNDVLMFERSGFSIAMGNASDEVKRQASAVTDSNEDEGFAKAVEGFLLGAGHREETAP